MRAPFLFLSLLSTATFGTACRCRPPANEPTASTQNSQFRNQLVKLLRQATQSLPNDCRAATWLIAELPLTQGIERGQLTHSLVGLTAQTEEDSASECLIRIRGELVKYLPKEEQPAAIESVVQSVLRSDFAWSAADKVLGEVSGLLNADQIARLQYHASSHCCLSSILAVILAKAQKVERSQAIEQLKQCEACPNEDAVRRLLSSLNQNERNQLLERKLELLNEPPPESWRLEQIYVVSRYVAFLEPEKQRELIRAVFHRLPQLVSEEQNMNIWDDLAPSGHFFLVLTAIAPTVSDEELAELGFRSIPQSWPEETRTRLLQSFAQALPPDTKKKIATTFFEVLPGPQDTLPRLKSQFAVAEGLPVEQLRVLIKQYVAREDDPRARAETLGEIYRLMPEEDRPDLQQQLMRDLHAVESDADRGNIIAAILGHQVH